MTAQPSAAPAALPEVVAPRLERSEIHCENCGHPVNIATATRCTLAGHVVSVVDITVYTFNAPRPRPFTARPAPYLGSSR